MAYHLLNHDWQARERARDTAEEEAMRTPYSTAYALLDLCEKDLEPVNVEALIYAPGGLDTYGMTAGTLLSVLLNSCNEDANRAALAALRDLVKDAMSDVIEDRMGDLLKEAA